MLELLLCDQVDIVICFGGLSSSFNSEKSPTVVRAWLWPGIYTDALVL